MKCLRKYMMFLLVPMASLFLANEVQAQVPVRISIKFIVNASGNRPATGNLNTDAEINSEVDWADTILRDNISELGIELLELYDLTGVSAYYNSNATNANRDSLRADAIAAPATYGWRTDAVNIYINAGTGSAISDFPPDNDIILMNQWCANNPSCILHELGHSLDLMHTHEPCCTNQDECADTIQDNQNWTRDQIAQNNFGDTYNNLTVGQQDQVDLVFNNVMSYHTGEPQLRLSFCQMNRNSTQADSDRGWLLSRTPVYVNSAYGGTIKIGRFTFPYSTLQSAVNAGLSSRVVVLQQGNYTVTTPISTNTTIVTRFGPSKIDQGALLYTLPVDLEKSKNPEVSNAIKAAQSEDKAARKEMQDARKAAKKAVAARDKASIMLKAEAKKKQYKKNALGFLLKAEKFLSAEDKVGIQYELGQRYRDADDCQEAIKYFNLVADNTTQIHLGERALLEAGQCQAKIDKSFQQAVPQEE